MRLPDCASRASRTAVTTSTASSWSSTRRRLRAAGLRGIRDPLRRRPAPRPEPRHRSYRDHAPEIRTGTGEGFQRIRIVAKLSPFTAGGFRDRRPGGKREHPETDKSEEEITAMMHHQGLKPARIRATGTSKTARMIATTSQCITSSSHPSCASQGKGSGQRGNWQRMVGRGSSPFGPAASPGRRIFLRTTRPFSAYRLRPRR
jgi:hypothetical protein